MSDLKWFLVSYHGEHCYECSGYGGNFIIAAKTEDEALKLSGYESWDIKPEVREFSLPDLKRKEKSFVLVRA